MQIQRRREQVIHDAISLVKTQALGMWRFRWFAVGFAWLICVTGWISVYAMPDVYKANARIYVDTENAIEDFLGGIAAPTDVMSEVKVVVREMTSRPNLAEVAHETDLALRAETDEQFQDLLTSLQNRISVIGHRDGIFSITFEDTDRDKALAVVDSLVTTFVDKSLGADRTDSAQAQQFLQEQIREYDERLTNAENRLAKFKQENVAFMPNQRGDYFARTQEAEAALQLTVGKLNLASERRAELERQIEGEEPVFGIMTTSPGTGGGGFTSAKIRELELQLEELRLQYTDKHPRIGQILETIELLKAQQAAGAQSQSESGANRPVPRNPLDLNPVYQNMRIQLSKVEVEIAALRAERNQQQNEVARLRRLVDTIPQVEAELNRLDRDYDVVKAKHQQLLQQLETANIGEDVSRSIDEIQFRIINPPFADNTPIGPNRPLFQSAVLLFAFGAGGALAFLMNQLKPTFVGSRSVTEVLGIPVLASVRLLQTVEQKRAERVGRYALQMSVILMIVSFSIVTMYSEEGSLLVRKLTAGIF